MKPFEHGGKTFDNANDWRAAKQSKAPMPTEQPEEAEPEDGEEIAAQHGPATTVTMEHEHEMGSHHVHSEHPDGHVHDSDHESAEAAHQHGMKLAGCGGGM